MSDEPDFRLDGLTPASGVSEQQEYSIWACDLTVLAEHHTLPDGTQSYFLAHDAMAAHGIPGDPQLAAIKITRDFRHRTYTFEAEHHSVLAFAQGWLVQRGCPPEVTTQVSATFPRPADDLTTRVEHKIRDSAARYQVITLRSCDTDDRQESWTLIRDHRAETEPVRVFLEEREPGANSYTVREGAFPDEDTARSWLDHRHGPLPQPPEDHGDTAGLRTRAALTRSTGTTAPTTCGLDCEPAPSPAMPYRPGPGRSL